MGTTVSVPYYGETEFPHVLKGSGSHGPSDELDSLLLSPEPAQVILSSVIRMTTCLIFFEEIFCIGVPALRTRGTPSAGIIAAFTPKATSEFRVQESARSAVK